MTTLLDMLDGYRRFRATEWTNQRARWEEFKDGQHPGVLVIACSDSRVDPTIIFDTHPGEIFVVRNVGALVPPFETTPGLHGVSSAVEFAIQILGIQEILVMGHGLCGGCHAALTQDMRDAPLGEGGFIAGWISMLDEARAKVVAEHGDDRSRVAGRAMEHAAVQVSLDNLRTFPWIKEKEERGALSLKGAYFAVAEGVLYLLDEPTGQFEPYEG
ncbi:MAG TPA: carbonic anhydrase [Sphingobium sp.]|nr:carbonic anhydrase [Sphingobium sp.]